MSSLSHPPPAALGSAQLLPLHMTPAQHPHTHTHPHTPVDFSWVTILMVSWFPFSLHPCGIPLPSTSQDCGDGAVGVYGQTSTYFVVTCDVWRHISRQACKIHDCAPERIYVSPHCKPQTHKSPSVVAAFDKAVFCPLLPWLLACCNVCVFEGLLLLSL